MRLNAQTFDVMQDVDEALVEPIAIGYSDVLPKPVRKGMLTKSIESTVARYQAMAVRPTLLKAQVVEKPRDAAEQQVSERIAGYLARLRGKTAFAGNT